MEFDEMGQREERIIVSLMSTLRRLGKLQFGLLFQRFTLVNEFQVELLDIFCLTLQGVGEVVKSGNYSYKSYIYRLSNTELSVKKILSYSQINGLF